MSNDQADVAARSTELKAASSVHPQQAPQWAEVGEMTVHTAELKTTGQDDLFRLAKGYYTTKALLAAWRMGILERAAAGEDLDVEALAAEWHSDASMLRPLFDYLIVRGYFESVG